MWKEKMLRNNYIKKEILLVQNQPCNILPITIISKEHFNIFWKIAFLLKLFSILFSKHFQALICFRVKIPWAVYISSILQAFSTIMTYNGTHRCIRKECNKLLPWKLWLFPTKKSGVLRVNIYKFYSLKPVFHQQGVYPALPRKLSYVTNNLNTLVYIVHLICFIECSKLKTDFIFILISEIFFDFLVFQYAYHISIFHFM